MPASSDGPGPVRLEATLPDNVALHARPAGAVVKYAATSPARLRIVAGERSADARSIVQVLGLGATGGTMVVIEAEGEGAASAAAELAALIAGL